jgi:FAD/FMN-containing dehydrogenase
VHVNPLVDVESPDWEVRVRATLAAVVELVAGLGGTLAGEHGDGRLRTPFVRTIWGDERADAFGRIKAAADPAGILNPGVIVALAGQDPLDGFTPRVRRVPVG